MQFHWPICVEIHDCLWRWKPFCNITCIQQNWFLCLFIILILEWYCFCCWYCNLIISFQLLYKLLFALYCSEYVFLCKISMSEVHTADNHLILLLRRSWKGDIFPWIVMISLSSLSLSLVSPCASQNWVYISLTMYVQICVAEWQGYILRNALLGDFVVVRTSWSALTQT